MTNISVNHENDVKSLSLDLDDLNTSNSNEVTFKMDTSDNDTNTINLESDKPNKNIDVGLDLLVNPKKQMRNDNSDEENGRITFNDKSTDKNNSESMSIDIENIGLQDNIKTNPIDELKIDDSI